MSKKWKNHFALDSDWHWKIHFLQIGKFFEKYLQEWILVECVFKVPLVKVQKKNLLKPGSFIFQPLQTTVWRCTHLYDQWRKHESWFLAFIFSQKKIQVDIDQRVNKPFLFVVMGVFCMLTYSNMICSVQVAQHNLHNLVLNAATSFDVRKVNLCTKVFHGVSSYLMGGLMVFHGILWCLYGNLALKKWRIEDYFIGLYLKESSLLHHGPLTKPRCHDVTSGVEGRAVGTKSTTGVTSHQLDVGSASSSSSSSSIVVVVVVVVVVVESSSSSNCCFGTCCCCSYCCSVGCCHPSSSKSKNSSKAMTREREMIKNSNSSNSIPKNCLYWHSFVQIWSLEVAEAYEHHPSHEIIDKGIPSLQHSTTSLKELSSNSFVL